MFKYLLQATLVLCASSSDKGKDFLELANENGFTVESHQVLTDDGYILSLYRIPGTLKEPTLNHGKPPVLLVHALDCDMIQWVVNTPDQAPAFVLSREGYDVWLGNNRGSRWSQGHLNLTTD